LAHVLKQDHVDDSQMFRTWIVKAVKTIQWLLNSPSTARLQRT